MIVTIFSNRYLKYILGAFFLLIFLLSRTFMGVYIFGFRIGELTILFSFVLLIYSIGKFTRERKDENLLDMKIIYLNLLLIVSFIYLSFIPFEIK